MLKPKDAAEAERIFSALAEDGTVQLPIAETFLGAAVRHGRRSIRGAVVDQLRETCRMKTHVTREVSIPATSPEILMVSVASERPIEECRSPCRRLGSRGVEPIVVTLSRA